MRLSFCARTDALRARGNDVALGPTIRIATARAYHHGRERELCNRVAAD